MRRSALSRWWVVALLAAASVPLGLRLMPSPLVVELTAEEHAEILRLSPLPPPPEDPTNEVHGSLTAALLGQRLFFDRRLSGDGTVSCASCHDPEQGWSDGRRRGEGMGTTERHTPSLWNVAYGRWYFWDGRVDSLWSQALQPLENPVEHGTSRLALAHLVVSDEQLRRRYEGLFGPLPELADSARFPPEGRPVKTDPEHRHHRAWMGMTVADREAVDRVFANLGKSLAAFERRIVSASSPFDTFVSGLRNGDRDQLAALSASAQRGLKLFVGDGGCTLCHSGPNFSDGEFHNLRLPQDPTAPRDTGRYGGIERLLADSFNELGPFSDDPTVEKVKFLVRRPDSWGQFKTPSLRNVARTAPYMHTAVFPTLERVLHFYSTFEGAAAIGHHDEVFLKPLRLTAEQIADLVAFLESLSGPPLPAELSSMPAPRLPSTSQVVATSLSRSGKRGAQS